MPPSEPAIVVLTGASGSGKTTVCLAVAARARCQPVEGIVTVPRLENGAPVGLDVMCLATGVRRPLAEVTGETDGPVVGKWRFHPAGLEFGNRCCAVARSDGLLVIDEFGPLELLRSAGWIEAIGPLRDRPGPSLVVVRPWLMEAFRGRVAGRPLRTVEVTTDLRNDLPGRVITMLEELG
ncbi:MAG: hypothetical protein NTV05_03380 [Acidobacteria bacterium]|nr:hypothetical protein [Acidobacteriota bacterium]